MLHNRVFRDCSLLLSVLTTADGKAPKDRIVQLILVSQASTRIGSDLYYAEECPAHEVRLYPFWMDALAVTNADFRRFVDDTSYQTTAEKPLDMAASSEMPDEYFEPGSVVFQMSEGPVPLDDPRNWWTFVPGASWRHPEGPDSSIASRMDHPVVHVSYFDALAFAKWCGKTLPTEKQWECAARAGSVTEYPWGTDLHPNGRVLANTWSGEFPWRHDMAMDGSFTCPVNTHEASALGFYNMIGNVWEWTSSRFKGPHSPEHSCCAPHRNMRSTDRMTLKGGSFLCAASYCERYRPAARSPQDAAASASHIGFRCAASYACGHE